MTCSFGDFLARILSLGCGQTSEFGTAIRERGGDEDGTETVKPVDERARVVPLHVSICCGNFSNKHLPVLSTDISSGVGRNTTAVDDNTEEKEADTSDDFEQAQSEFNLEESEVPYAWDMTDLPRRSP